MENTTLNYINGGKLSQDILKYVTTSTEKLINTLVQKKGITIADNTLERIYNFTEVYARQLTETISSEALNDVDFTTSDKQKTNIYLP